MLSLPVVFIWLLVRRVLEITGNNRTEAAKILKIGERTLYRKIKDYNL